MTTLPDFEARTITGDLVNRAAVLHQAPVLLVLLRGLM
jgi:hypothetical protein